MWTETGLGSYSGRLWEAFSSYPLGPLMRQERLLSVGTDGGGYINLCTNKDDLSLWVQEIEAKMAQWLAEATAKKAAEGGQ